MYLNVTKDDKSLLSFHRITTAVFVLGHTLPTAIGQALQFSPLTGLLVSAAPAMKEAMDFKVCLDREHHKGTKKISGKCHSWHFRPMFGCIYKCIAIKNEAKKP